MNTGFQSSQKLNDMITGAWTMKNGDEEETLLFMDGYFTHTAYNSKSGKFQSTCGGPVTISKDNLLIQYEFDTRDKEQVGSSQEASYTISGDNLKISKSGETRVFKRVDNGQAPLAGVWRITKRMQEGQLVPVHQSGTRKTLKILTGKRFQWAAIDPGAKTFSGTGGGSYTFQDGKYTEHIEFFSRDSSRVGASLSFDGRMENGEWHHSGLSSRGDKIYEVWGKVGDTRTK